ncbi:hypothetical protein M9458_052951, partial [Cirrhinus mrigala]
TFLTELLNCGPQSDLMVRVRQSGLKTSSELSMTLSAVVDLSSAYSLSVRNNAAFTLNK